MTQYLLAMYYDDEATPPADELEQIMKDVEALNAELRDEGSWVFSNGLHPASTATVVRTHDGGVLTTDGPFLETKEQLGGFWIIAVDDLDAALAVAARATAALRGLPIEVRPFQDRAGG
jgi:hypothetical protein